MEWAWNLSFGEEVKQFLVVYNITELKNKGNLSYYKAAISSILNQRYDDFSLIVSGYKVTKETKKALFEEFDHSIMYCWTDFLAPVNVTFNLSCLNFIKNYGRVDGYIYMDSGITFGYNKTVLGTFNDYFNLGDWGLISMLPDTDCGSWGWFPEGLPDSSFIVPIGRTTNLHVCLFSDAIVEFYGRPLPDIFASNCSETIFSFLASAIGKRYLIIRDFELHHEHSLDGPSCSFPTQHPWDHTYNSPRSIKEILGDFDGHGGSLGYEEMSNVLKHDPAHYEQGLCKNGNLKTFIRDNFFLKKPHFDYDQIPCEFIH